MLFAMSLPRPARAVRPPDPTRIDPHAQHGGDWAFAYEMALEFLDETRRRLEESFSPSDSAWTDGRRAVLRAAVHSIKTGAELLCITSVAFAAYDVEKGIAEDACDLDVMELEAVLIETVLDMRVALTAPEVAGDPAAALAAVDGHFDLLRKQHIRRITDESGSAGSIAAEVATPRSRRTSAACLVPFGEAPTRALPKKSSTFSAGQRPRRRSSVASLSALERVFVVGADSVARKVTARAIVEAGYLNVETFRSVDALPRLEDTTSFLVYCHSVDDAPFGPQLAARVHEAHADATVLWVVVGDVCEETLEHIHTRCARWCDVVRSPPNPAELVRRMESLHRLHHITQLYAAAGKE